MKLYVVLSVAIASVLVEVQSHPLMEQVWSASYAYPTTRVIPFKAETAALRGFDWPFSFPFTFNGVSPFTFPFGENWGYYPMTEVVVEREDPDKKIEHKEEKVEEHKEEEHKDEEHKEEEHKEEEHKEEEHKEEEHKEEEHKEEEHKEEEHKEEEHKEEGHTHEEEKTPEKHE